MSRSGYASLAACSVVWAEEPEPFQTMGEEGGTYSGGAKISMFSIVSMRLCLMSRQCKILAAPLALYEEDSEISLGAVRCS